MILYDENGENPRVLTDSETIAFLASRVQKLEEFAAEITRVVVSHEEALKQSVEAFKTISKVINND